jgi:hypothetical protein
MKKVILLWIDLLKLLKYSEKTHGSNLGVCFNNQTGLYVQSRKNIITPEKDNAGSAFFVMSKEEIFKSLILELAEENNIDLDNYIISLYGEWAGANIQKNANVSGLDKMVILFDYFKVSPLIQDEEDSEAAQWYETKSSRWVDSIEDRIFNVNNFPGATGFIEVDFEHPAEANNKLIEIMEDFEKNSPIAKYFNKPENVGEGIVCSFIDERGNRNVFKVKGEAHSKGSGKVKTLKPVDSVLEQKKIDFVNDIACTESRLGQMWTEIVHSVHNGDESLMEMKQMGDFLRLVIKDVIKEEFDIMAERGLEPKPLNGLISKVARGWFQDKLDGGAGL